MATVTPPRPTGQRAPEFSLPGTDGRIWSLPDVAGPRGLVVAFICNHCPYVQTILRHLIQDARELLGLGVGVVAISSNDPVLSPEDGFEQMCEISKQHAFPFPYLFDESQEVARAYDAVCTPDFFGYNARMELQYSGRLAAANKLEIAADARRELFEAMQGIAKTGVGPANQIASMGCSIKWREGSGESR